MVSLILERKSPYDSIAVFMNWGSLSECWKVVKSIGLRKDYQEKYDSSGGEFDAKEIICELDQKAADKKLTLKDLKNLTISVNNADYIIVDVTDKQDGFQKILEKCVAIAKEKQGYATNNYEPLSALLEDKGKWNTWRRNNRNYVVYYAKYNVLKK